MKPFLFIIVLCGICFGHVLPVNPKKQVETAATPDVNSTQLLERQASCTWVATFDKNYPTPDPHQIYLHKQLSVGNSPSSKSAGNVEMADRVPSQEPITGGAVSVESSVTFTVGSSASGGDGKGFFGGGFDVSESVTTGFSDACEAENGAETVCLWKRIAHTRVSRDILLLRP